MSYVALYRKYRPKTFDDVQGQSVIINTLRNEVINNQLSHAYLFCGPRGTGKTSVAKILSKAVNCKNPVNGNPCGECECCKLYDSQLNIDIIEIDAASNNGVDSMRDLIAESKYMPQYGKYKVYIIDEVHMLSTSAFNALLKTLEEPTGNIIFILATTEQHKVPKTIVSRCQKFNFRLIDNNTIAQTITDILVKENINWDVQAVNYIAKVSKGGLRDALTLLGQCVVADSKLTLNTAKEISGEADEDELAAMIGCIQNSDVKKLLDLTVDINAKGRQLDKVADALYEYYREACYRSEDNSLNQRYMEVLADLKEKLRFIAEKHATFETAMIRLCSLKNEMDYSSVCDRLSGIENLVKGISPSQIANNANTDGIEKEFIRYPVYPCIGVQANIY